jgi:hypothetical protein
MSKKTKKQNRKNKKSLKKRSLRRKNMKGGFIDHPALLNPLYASFQYSPGISNISALFTKN